MGSRKTMGFTAAVLVLAAAAFLVAPAPAQAASTGVTVQSVSVSGSSVTVTVRNNSMLPFTGYVAVKAMVGDTPIWSFVPLVLLPGQSNSVNAGFMGTVNSTVSVGISDCPVPF